VKPDVQLTPDGKVLCAKCGAVLDKVPDRYSAIWRAGKYLEHVCRK